MEKCSESVDDPEYGAVDGKNLCGHVAGLSCAFVRQQPVQDENFLHRFKIATLGACVVTALSVMKQAKRDELSKVGLVCSHVKGPPCAGGPFTWELRRWDYRGKKLGLSRPSS